MTTARSIVCGSCGSDVPYGRLSCPACGDLLASVAGGTRRVSSAAAHATGTATATPAAARSGGQRVPPSVLHDASEAVPSATLAFDDEPLEAARAVPEPRPAEPARLRPAPAWIAPSGVAVGGLFDDDADGGDAPLAPDAAETDAPVATVPPVAVVDEDDAFETAASETAASPASADGAPRPAPFRDAPPPIVDGGPPLAASGPPLPGAYVPPVAAMTAGHLPAVAYAMPAGPAAPARSWAGHGASSVTTDVGAASTTDRAVDGARLAEFVGWLAIAGGALAAVGFLLPWGASMIGATGVGYLDRWGLAGPFHVIVALAVVALVVSTIVPNRVPAWARIGLGGTILGVFLMGLVWPYVFGFSSTGPGALAVGLGAVALVSAGITSLVTDRHARTTPPV